MATTHQPGQRGVPAFRNVFTFSVIAHLADIITTHWRAPSLSDEGNALYLFLARSGLGGWPALIGIKVVVVGVLAFGYWWYLHVRAGYVPRRRIESFRGLIWYSMWDGREYPRSVLRRVLNLRELQFGVMIMSAIALPASAVAALYYSVDNALWAMENPLPSFALPVFVGVVTPTMFVWWCLAFRQYCEEQRQLRLAADGGDGEG
jgi:hypothetical protein